MANEKQTSVKSFNKARELTIRTVPMPADTITDDFISAGWLLSQMDLAGGRRSYRYIEGRCVTIGIEAMSFKKPVHIGDEVSIYTQIEKEGTTSLRVGIEAFATRHDNSTEKVTEGTFTFVAIDENRRPVAIRGGDLPEKTSAPEGKKAPPPQPATPSTLALRTVPMPADTNYNGDIFGGWILAQMDKACAKQAEKLSGFRAATVGLEAMKFIKPVFVGDEVSFFTEIVKVGRTSVSVRVESWALRQSGTYEKVTEGRFTYVTVDASRKPVPVKAAP